jgi:uncharacterized membrane protein YdbT with pleckstrin-like domain
VLQPNEQVVAIGRLHWIIYGSAIALLALAVAGFVCGMAIPESRQIMWLVALILVGVAALLTFRAWFEQWITEIAVTDMRVIFKTGFIRRRTSEMNMSKVESVTVNQSMLGRLLGYGTVHIRGTGEGIEHLHRIASPLEFRTAIIAR